MSIDYCSSTPDSTGCHTCTICGYTCCGDWICTACSGGCVQTFLFDARTGDLLAERECPSGTTQALLPIFGLKSRNAGPAHAEPAPVESSAGR